MTPAEQPEIRPDASRRASPQRVAVIAVRRDSLVALGGLVVFFAIVLGGYVGKWTWTGFRGNTLWDWLHLLLLPLLLPTLVVPALKPMAASGVVVVDEEVPGKDPESDPRDAREGEPGGLPATRPDHAVASVLTRPPGRS